MLFQEGALFNSMDVFQNVAFPLPYHKLFSRNQIEKKVQAFLDLVGMQGYAGRSPESFPVA